MEPFLTRNTVFMFINSSGEKAVSLLGLSELQAETVLAT